MPLLRTALLLIATLVFAACGDDSTSDPGPSSADTPPEASYELTADGPECSEGAQVSRSTTPTGCTVIGCTWLCAEYEGQSAVDVNVKLRGCPGEPWELLSETVLNSAASTCEAYND